MAYIPVGNLAVRAHDVTVTGWQFMLLRGYLDQYCLQLCPQTEQWR